MAYYRIPNPKRTKLRAQGIKSIFVGYAQNSKAYRFLDLQSNMIVESRDAEFFEDKLSKDIIERSNPTIEYLCHKRKLFKVLKGKMMLQ